MAPAAAPKQADQPEPRLYTETGYCRDCGELPEDHRDAHGEDRGCDYAIRSHAARRLGKGRPR